MANDEFDIYFQRAKNEEIWSNNDLPVPPRTRRSSLPALPLSSSLSPSSPLITAKARRQSFKNSRKKSVPYSPHDLSANFPETIPEVSCSDLTETDVNIYVQSEPCRRRSLTPQINGNGKIGSNNDFHKDSMNSDSDTEENLKPEVNNGDEYEEVCFIRNFRTSSKGIEHRGDSVKRTRRSSTATCSFEHSGGRKKGLWLAPELSALDFAEVALRATSLKNCEITRSVSNVLRNSYKVLIIGDKQVGKTSLTRQLMTSQLFSTFDSPQDCATLTSIGVSLDGEETVIELEEQRPPQDKDPDIAAASAYIVLFAVDSNASYKVAKELVEKCMLQHGEKAAVLMVANKTDLVRRRAVSTYDARSACKRLGCKFIEVSVTLGHHVDDLLVGVVRQIHLNPKRDGIVPHSPEKKATSSPKTKTKTTNCFSFPKGITKKLSLKNVSQNSSDCENLAVL